MKIISNEGARMLPCPVWLTIRNYRRAIAFPRQTTWTWHGQLLRNQREQCWATQGIWLRTKILRYYSVKVNGKTGRWMKRKEETSRRPGYKLECERYSSYKCIMKRLIKKDSTCGHRLTALIVPSHEGNTPKMENIPSIFLLNFRSCNCSVYLRIPK